VAVWGGGGWSRRGEDGVRGFEIYDLDDIPCIHSQLFPVLIKVFNFVILADDKRLIYLKMCNSRLQP